MAQATETPVFDIEALIKRFHDEAKKASDERNSALMESLGKQIDEKWRAHEAALEKKFSTFSLPGSAEEKHKGQKYSFAKAMQSVLQRNPSLAPMEHAMSEELRGFVGTTKAMSFGNDASVGFLVPNEVMQSEIIPLLYPQLVIKQLGARMLDGLTRAPIQFPKVSGGTTAGWIGEGGTLTPSDMSTQMVEATPHGLYAVTVISHLLSLLENSGAEAMIREDMATAMALKWDLACVKGTGSSSQPRGIINWSGVNTASISNTVPTYDELLGAINAVREDNALQGKLGWLFSNADLFLLEKMKDKTVPPATAGDGDVNVQPLGTRQWLSGAWPNYSLLGFPLKSTTQLANGEGPIFGNWNDLVMCRWGGMSLTMTDALGLLTGQSHIRLLMWVDNVVRQPVSFNVG